MINLVSPVRKKVQLSARPLTGLLLPQHTRAPDTATDNVRSIGDGSGAGGDQRSRRTGSADEKIITIDQNTEAGADIESPAKVKVEDSFEVYQKEVFERHQAEDAQDYVRKVLLEDIMYYRATNQDKKILQMEKVAEGEQGSVEKMRSLLAAKRAQKGSVTTTSLRDTSQGPNRSNDYLLDTTSMKKSNHYRPGARAPHDHSELWKSKQSRSGGRPKSHLLSRPGYSSNEGTSMNEGNDR